MASISMRIKFVLVTILVFVLAVAAGVAGAASPVPGDDVEPGDLARLIDKADRVVVLQGPRPGAAVLYESSRRNDIDALRAAMAVNRPGRYLHCMCDGTPTLVFYSQGKIIGQVSNHHAHLIRYNLWRSDALLAKPEALLKWFDDRKIAEPRKEYELSLKLQKEADEAGRKWVASMPPSLKPVWASLRTSFNPDRAPLRRALETGVSEKNDRILALYSWYGSGEGPWSGFPSYESIAEEMLLDYSTDELVTALKGKELTEAQIEGGARLFGGWAFSNRRPNDLRLLPAELKAQLLKHSLASKDTDKRERAQSAFGGK